MEKLDVDGKIILKFVKETLCETSGCSVCVYVRARERA